MKKNRLSVGVLSILFILPLLWGCPYESECPLSKVSRAKIDPALLGEWKNTKEGEQFTMIIRQFNDHELLIMGIEDREIQQEVMRAFTTDLQDKRFLNVQEIRPLDKKRGWLLIKYTISGDTLTAWTIDDKLFTKPFISSRALYRFVKKNLHNKDLYGDDPPMVLQRLVK